MRQVPRHRIIAGVVLGALPLLLSTGCSFDFSIGGPGSVSAEEVAEKSMEMLAEQPAGAPDEFTCSEDLPAEVGAEIRCELTNGGESVGVTITTTSVDGDRAEWDIKVDDAPAEDTAAEDEGAAQDEGAAEDGAAEETGGDENSTAASGGEVPVSEVIEQSTTALEAEGYAPENLACTSTSLRAEVGAEMSCNFFEDSVYHDVTITVTTVEGSSVLWNIQVDEA
ncbi:DUF4333 domain-containing protein [Nocardiopsis terrae]